MAKCPHCNKQMSSIDGQAIAIKVKTEFNGIAYCCPNCDAVLSVMIDQMAVKNDTVSDIMRRMERR